MYFIYTGGLSVCFGLNLRQIQPHAFRNSSDRESSILYYTFWDQGWEIHGVSQKSCIPGHVRPPYSECKWLSLPMLMYVTLRLVKVFLLLAFKLAKLAQSYFKQFKDFNINHILCITLNTFIHWFHSSSWNPALTPDSQVRFTYHKNCTCGARSIS